MYGKMNSCHCCISKRTGALIVAVLSLIGSVAVITIVGIDIIPDIYGPYRGSILDAAFLMFLVLTAFLTVLMNIGVLRGDPTYIFPWLCNMVTIILGTFGVTVIWTVIYMRQREYSIEKIGFEWGVKSIAIAVEILFALIVYNYYNSLLKHPEKWLVPVWRKRSNNHEPIVNIEDGDADK